MSKKVAFLPALFAWMAFSAPSLLASGFITEAFKDDTCHMNMHSSSGTDTLIGLGPSLEIFDTSPAQTVLSMGDIRAPYRGATRGWADRPLSSFPAGPPTGSLLAAHGTTWYIDPHTFCMTVTGDGYGMCETCAASNSFSSDGRGHRSGSPSSPVPQSGFMVVAGITLIGLSSLWKSRKSGSRVPACAMQNQFQPWRTRAWKDNPAGKSSVFQVKAA